MSWLHHGIDNALGRGFPQENLHATEKTYENMLLVHWEIVFLAPCLPKKTWRSLHAHSNGGGIISDSSLADPLVSRARWRAIMIRFCCFKVQAVSSRYVCCLYPSKPNSQVAVCQLPSQIYLAIGDATNDKVWVNGIRLKCLWVFWRARFLWPKV